MQEMMKMYGMGGMDASMMSQMKALEDENRRLKRMFADLRDVLLAASRVQSVSADTRKAQLRDIAGMCESQLRDVETAISAWKQICQIDRGDDQAREQLRRLLEKASKWDDLAMLLMLRLLNYDGPVFLAAERRETRMTDLHS